MKKKAALKRVAVALALLMALSICLTSQGVYATEETETPAPSNGVTADDLRNDLAGIRQNLDAARVELDKAESEFKTLKAQIASMEAEIKATEDEIAVLEAQIAEYNRQIEALTAQIEALEIEISDQNSDLNQRLRVMYETSEQSILAVLLDSESFVDFLSNLEMVRMIHESDKEFLEELERKLDDVEKKRAEVQALEDKLQTEKATLETKKAKLDADKAVLDVAKQRAQQIRDAVAQSVAALEAESKQIEQELANMTREWGDYGGGAMAWPVIGPITSEFGSRIHPILGYKINHDGIDIGVPTGTPVHAAADGIVYRANWSDGYGNIVGIDHGTQDGKSIVTVYAHNSGFAVSKGTVVHRGDVIAYAGSTGRSTGPHVHFEVRVATFAQNPRGWLG
jgi:murein DD-endopeptidase MepM/ murein hydrolase activator NlpD